MRISVLVSACLLGFLPCVLYANDDLKLEMTSALSLGHWSGSKNLDDSGGRAVATMQNKLIASSDQSKLTADMLTTQRNEGNGLHVRPRELYFQFRHEDWLVRIGRQTVNWGQSDFLNPTQRFAVIDNQLLASQQGLEQSGVEAVRIFKSLGNLNLDFVVAAFDKGSVIPLGPLQVAGLATRDSAVGHHAMGIRVSNSDPVHEFSVSFFSGHDVAPMYRFASPYLVEAFHPRLAALGFDYVYSVGEYAVKFEAAITKNRDPGDPSGYAPLDQFHAVAGIEVKVGDYTFAGAYSQKQVNGFREEYLANPLLRFNLTAADQLSQRPKDALLRITKMSPDLDSGGVAVVRKSLTDSGLAMLLSYQWKLTPGVTSVSGINVFQGNEKTYLGAFKKNTLLWTALRVSY